MVKEESPAIKAYTDVLLKPITKVVVLLFITALLVAGSVLASRAQVEFDLTELTQEGAITDRFIFALRDYFLTDEGIVPGSLFYHELDVSDAEMRKEMLEFREDIMELGETLVPSNSFLVDFETFLDNATAFNISVMPFSEQLDSFFNVTEYQNAYEAKVVRDSSGNIATLREDIFLSRRLDSTSDKVDLLTGQRKVTLEQPLNDQRASDGVERMFFYRDDFFLFEHFRIIPRELIISLVLSVSCNSLRYLFASSNRDHTVCAGYYHGGCGVGGCDRLGWIHHQFYYLRAADHGDWTCCRLQPSYCAYFPSRGRPYEGRGSRSMPATDWRVCAARWLLYVSRNHRSGVLVWSSILYVLCGILFHGSFGAGSWVDLCVPVVLSLIDGADVVVSEDNTLHLASCHFSMRASGRKSLVLIQQESHWFTNSAMAAR